MTVRVMKARKSSRLGCGHYVLRGELITRQGDGWRCLDCAIRAMRAANDHPATGGATKEGTP